MEFIFNGAGNLALDFIGQIQVVIVVICIAYCIGQGFLWFFKSERDRDNLIHRLLPPIAVAVGVLVAPQLIEYIVSFFLPQGE